MHPVVRQLRQQQRQQEEEKEVPQLLAIAFARSQLQASRPWQPPPDQRPQGRRSQDLHARCLSTPDSPIKRALLASIISHVRAVHQNNKD